MPVLATFSTRVNDWQALHSVHRETLIRQARELGATRYQVFRNAHNVSEAMMVVELPTHEDAHEMAQSISIQLLSLVADDTYCENIWESMGWEKIG